jgi:hypothetical protein
MVCPQVLDVIKWNGKLQMGTSNKPPPTAPHGNHTYVPLLVPNTWWWGNNSYNDTWDTVIVNGGQALGCLLLQAGAFLACPAPTAGHAAGTTLTAGLCRCRHHGQGAVPAGHRLLLGRLHRRAAGSGRQRHLGAVVRAGHLAGRPQADSRQGCMLLPLSASGMRSLAAGHAGCTKLWAAPALAAQADCSPTAARHLQART